MLKTWLKPTKTKIKTSQKRGPSPSSSPTSLPGSSVGFLHVFGKTAEAGFRRLIREKCFPWQAQQILDSTSPLHHFPSSDGVHWVVSPLALKKKNLSAGYGYYRDVGGSLVGHLKSQSISSLNLHLEGLKQNEELGFLTGLEVGSYQFKKAKDDRHGEDLPQVHFSQTLKQLEPALLRAQSVNLARHLVNLPPNEAHPGAFAAILKKLEFSSHSTIEIWDEKKLKSENMNLLLAVGGGAVHKPCLVRIKYRPRRKTTKQPIAFVGKGITFDTGGLDIKPSSAMRLMKKDMGGAATVLALAKWVDSSGYSRPCDFYLSLAENAVDANSFRPSDVIVSRAGLKVEIDNTDAEGRLVLADALDLAVTQTNKDEPEIVVDVATLTGAIKVALGAELAGLFCNDDKLSRRLMDACERTDDLAWRMPLVQKYFTSLSSPFADFKNSAEGFGGAITAALFLEKFIRAKKWAHFDIYAWADKPQGAIQSVGGNGQMVQALIDFLESEA